jgi:hypothetical protein
MHLIGNWNTYISELVHQREKHFKCVFHKCVYAGPSIDGLRAHLRNAHARYLVCKVKKGTFWFSFSAVPDQISILFFPSSSLYIILPFR